MGGIFLFLHVLYAFIGSFCTYLFTQWVPINTPFYFEEWLLEFILDPLLFLAAATVFFIGFLMQAKIVHILIHLVTKRLPFNGWDIVACLIFLISLFVHIQLGIIQTMAIYLFSLIYGFVSVR
jgi:hypothetical protein